MSGPSTEFFGAVGAIAALGVHEGAHTLLAAALGREVRSVEAGAWRVWRERGRLRAGWAASAPFGGWTSARTIFTLDGLDQRTLRSSLLITSAGAVLASLLTGALAFLIGYVLRSTSGASSGSDGLLLFGVWSLGIGLLTLLPQRWGGGRSDGAWLWRLRSDSPQARRALALAVISDGIRRGQEPRDWDAGALEEAWALDDTTVDAAYAAQYCYYSALDRNDLPAAAAAVARTRALQAKVPPSRRGYFRHFVELEGAFIAAHYRGDTATARRLLDSALPCQPGCTTRIRAEAALLFAEGRDAEARERLREAMASPHSPFERRLLEDLSGP